MKQISNKKYEEYMQYQRAVTFGRILSPASLRLVCDLCDSDPEKIGIYMLEKLAQFEREGILDKPYGHWDDDKE